MLKISSGEGWLSIGFLLKVRNVQSKQMGPFHLFAFHPEPYMLPPFQFYSISKLLVDPASTLDTFPTTSTYKNWEIPATPSEATSGSRTLNENLTSLKTPQSTQPCLYSEAKSSEVLSRPR